MTIKPAFYALVSLCLIFSISSGCKQNKSQKETEVLIQEPTEFTSGNLMDASLDPSLIQQMEQAIAAGEYPNIHSVLILKDQKLVYENYFEGEDEIWGEKLGKTVHHSDSLHDVRSVSKSVVATCVGIAIKQGKIKDVNQKIFAFFPEYKEYDTGKRSQLTIKHLLNMSSGMEWNENVPYDNPENSEIQMTSSEDPIAFVLSRAIITEPGEAWEYNGGTTQLLSAIIEKVSGSNIHEFAKQYLFKPLGINRSEWTNFPGTELPAAASGLRLRSRDMMKLGLLYANNGKWDNRQILTEAWVQEATQAHIRFGRNNVGYGYQFWILPGDSFREGQTHEIAAAFGNGGQRIYIDYIHHIVVVVTAGNYNQWTIEKDSESLLIDFVYPAIMLPEPS
ncbi:MAG: serine hydrolase [Bacteroidota bacterium]